MNTNIGKTVRFEATEEEARITDENERAIYVESKFFTGWIPKTAECEDGLTLAEVLA